MRIRDGFTGERFIAVPLQAVQKMEKNAMTRELFVFAIGHFPEADHHYVSRMGGCDEYILIYCVNGAGTVEINGTRHTLHHDQMIIIPRGASHVYYSDEHQPWTIYWIHFRGQLAEHYAERMDHAIDIEVTTASRREERNRLFDELYDILDQATTMDDLEYSSALLMHYLATFRFLNAYRQFGTIDMDEGVCRSDTIVRKAIHYMNENLEQRMDIAQLSALCGYSSSYLFRKFKKETGMAPMTYFIRQKINRACFLLLHTNMTINQISMKLAFSESQFFARTFKKIMGTSATEYRKSIL